MSARRPYCTSKRHDGTLCQLEQHTERVHTAYVNGWLHEWIDADEGWRNIDLRLADPLQDAPESLKRTV